MKDRYAMAMCSEFQPIASGIRTRRIRSCVLCGTAGELQHNKLKDHVFGSPGVWSIRRCPKCLLAWADPQPIPADIGKLYQTYFTHGGPSAPDAQVSSAKKRLLKRLLSVVMPWRRHALLSDGRYLFGRQPGRLLDVGCGTGDFLAGMQQLGWTCHGVEFDEGATARQHEGVRILPGSVEDQHFAKDSFDAIALSNVIEHLPDPIGTFSELARILAPGGRLVMITPNINSLGHKVFGRCWHGLEPPRHLYLYNRTTLRRLASGLEVEACFTVLGGGGILESSLALWNRKPRDRRPSLLAIKLRERISTAFNSDEGEFVVLIATKQ